MRKLLRWSRCTRTGGIRERSGQSNTPSYFYTHVVIYLLQVSLSLSLCLIMCVWVVGMATSGTRTFSNNQQKTLDVETLPRVSCCSIQPGRWPAARVQVMCVYNSHCDGHFAKQFGAGPPDNNKSLTRQRKKKTNPPKKVSLENNKMLEPAIIKTKVAPQFGGPALEGCLCLCQFFHDATNLRK